MGMFDGVPGLDGYQKQVMMNQATDAANMNRLAQLLSMQEHGMKMQAMQDQQMRQNRIRDALMQADQPQAQQAPAAPYGGGYSPSVAQAFGVPPGRQESPATAPGGEARALAARLNRTADIYERNGEPEAAIKLREHAQKLLPELKDEQVRMGPNGKPVVVRNYKDGTTEVSPFGPAEKLHFADNGQQAGIGIDPYTGRVMSQGVQKFQTPDSIASTNSAAAGRAQAERHFLANQNVPQYQMTNEGLVMLPKKLAAGEVPVATPVTSASGAPLGKELKPLPAAVNEAFIGNAMSLRTLDKAIKLAKGEDVDSSKGDTAATGWKGYLPQAVLNRVDPSGVDTRAEIADIGSLKIHDRSGAAVTVSESPRLMPFIPQATDDKATVVRKLTRLYEEAQAMQGMLGDAYSKEQGYKTPPIGSRKPPPSPEKDIHARAEAILNGGK